MSSKIILGCDYSYIEEKVKELDNYSQEMKKFVKDHLYIGRDEQVQRISLFGVTVCEWEHAIIGIDIRPDTLAFIGRKFISEVKSILNIDLIEKLTLTAFTDSNIIADFYDMSLSDI